MNRLTAAFTLGLGACLASGGAVAADSNPPQAPKHHSHASEVAEYKGTQTCAGCHPEAAKEVATSLHYQHLAGAPNLEDWPAGKLAGMMSNY